ncbi:hypothetical protein HPHPH5B_0881 [Helicobacter pylori Hp H-5b]|nr:hypothetical protein [Helicobacter pylori]EJC27452.1 hypothetical protein HPHPH5B_0881 [Helicobacter pylori Hp H-5b]
MLLDYDFLLLLNDESGKPTRYYYLLQDFEKDFVASKVAQNERVNSLRKSLGGRKSLKLKTAPLKFLIQRLLLLGAERLEVVILKRRVKKSKADYPLGYLSL